MVIVDEMNKVLQDAILLHSEAAVEAALDNIAEQMTEKLAKVNPLFLCVMNGGVIPMGRLLTRLAFPLELDYIHVTRYQGKTEGGDLHWRVVPSRPLENRTIVIVDDILDGGLTLQGILHYCQAQGAKALHTAVLVTKKRQRSPVALQAADFSGVDVDDVYVFGYGLDYHEYWRNAPGIYMPKM